MAPRPASARRRALLCAAALACAFAAPARAAVYHWNPDATMSDAAPQGANAARNWTDSVDGGGYWPPSPKDDAFSGASLGAAWSLVDSTGDTAHPAGAALDGGALSLTAHGGDLDDGAFAVLRRTDLTGDFDVAVKVGPVSGGSPKAGILIHDDFDHLAAGGACALFRGPTGGIYARFDLEAPVGVPDLPDAPPAATVPLSSPVWLRAARQGTLFYGFYRLAPEDPWILFAKGTSQAMASSSQVGLFVAAAGDTVACAFDDFAGGGALDVPAGLDLRFDGGTPGGRNADASLTADLDVDRVEMSGFGGFFSFGSHTLTARHGASFELVNRATGGFVCQSGTLTLGATTQLPDIRKTGSDTVFLQGSPLNARRLSLDQGALAFGSVSATVTGLATASGTALLQDSGASLTVRGDADFSGAAAGSRLKGGVYVSAQADVSGPTSFTFTPGACAFRDLRLEATPRVGNAAILSVAGAAGQIVTVQGTFVLSDGSTQPQAEGTVDLGAARYEVAGNLQAVHPGGSAPALAVKLGSAVLSLGGSLDLSLAKRIEPGTSSLLLGAGSHTLKPNDGSRDNGSLGSIQVTGGDVSLASPLKAAGYAQTGGSLALSGFGIDAAQDLSLEAGGGGIAVTGLGGAELKAERDMAFAGRSGAEFDLTASPAWKADAGRALTASYAAIAHSQAIHAHGTADAASRDLGGNSFWNFPFAPPSIYRQPADTTVARGARAVFSVGSLGAQPMAYAWTRAGSAAVLSTDSILTLDSAALSGAYRCKLTNANGSLDTRDAVLTVLCDTAFSVAADSVNVDEGQAFALGASVACAEDWKWEALSGPAPADAKALAQSLKAPRVAADSGLAYRFSARYAGAWRSRDVRVKVREAIPDPLFSLPADFAWNGNAPLALKPSLSNASALAASAYHPAVTGAWSLSALLCDTARSGDSLILSNAKADGNMEASWCADNGGAPHCARAAVAIARPTSLAPGILVIGPAAIAGGRIHWNAAGSARLWSWDGRLRWSATGRAGSDSRIPPAAERAWREGRARLSVRTAATPSAPSR